MTVCGKIVEGKFRFLLIHSQLHVHNFLLGNTELTRIIYVMGGQEVVWGKLVNLIPRGVSF